VCVCVCVCIDKTLESAECGRRQLHKIYSIVCGLQLCACVFLFLAHMRWDRLCRRCSESNAAGTNADDATDQQHTQLRSLRPSAAAFQHSSDEDARVQRTLGVKPGHFLPYKVLGEFPPPALLLAPPFLYLFTHKLIYKAPWGRNFRGAVSSHRWPKASPVLIAPTHGRDGQTEWAIRPATFFTSLQFLWRGVMTRQEICVGHLPDLALAYHGQLIPYML